MILTFAITTGQRLRCMTSDTDLAHSHASYASHDLQLSYSRSPPPNTQSALPLVRHGGDNTISITRSSALLPVSPTLLFVRTRCALLSPLYFTLFTTAPRRRAEHEPRADIHNDGIELASTQEGRQRLTNSRLRNERSGSADKSIVMRHSPVRSALG